MAVIRIAVVSPLPAVRAGLRAMLASAGDETLQVVAEAASLEMLEMPASLVDILLFAGEASSLPQIERWIDSAGASSQLDGRLSVLVMAREGRPVNGLQRLPLRAWGLLGFDATVEELTAAMHALAQGLWVADPLLGRAIISTMPFAAEGEAPASESLTERESEVLQLLARGLANKQIAALLGISEHTVKFHVSSIYNRLGASNRAEAVRKGIQQGLVVL
jgi:DNA-binding NarL/FixJ family response regulator